ncbi:class I SAM-dependent methyltransferase [Imbroritus primus]|uniref:class I SAM-dependent methyltransferase n=1 Tax=Imbroritus primus TaxID=3058603 RepID=UPI003D160A84
MIEAPVSMNALSLPCRRAAAAPATLDTRAFPTSARLALQLLARLRNGSLLVTFPDGQQATFGTGHGLHADITLRDWRCCDAALRSGDIGFAETFIDGGWTTSDLASLLDLFVVNRKVIDSFVYGTWWGRLWYRLRHLLNHNSRGGSRRNIHAHYDLGNAFYSLWLDASMTYSSGLFPEAARAMPADACDLEAAQQAKYRRILEELDLAPGASLLEVGCGWGGFAEFALRRDLSVTGLTLSTEQLDWAQRRCVALAPGRVDLRLQDYRDCYGRFDGIVSIEMFEAVGERYWPAYFDSIRRNLKPGGRACIQTIVIDDALFDRYRKGTDFIQQYIFPGGMLPSPTVFRQQAARAGLRVCNELAFGPDYALTLRAWRMRFLDQLAAVRAQGFDEPFQRTWLFYLCYCEAAFRHGNTDVIQFTLEHAQPA